MEHFANRSAQAQQHVYSTSPYNLYPSQPPYIAGYQAVPQHHPVTFQQGPSHYTRPSLGAGPAANSVQQRRAGNEIGGNGMNRGSGVHQGNIPSGSIAHPGSMQQPGSVSADGPHSIAQGITPLAASLNQHHRITSAQDMPLRIVVDARYVGAIIGQGGSSIREITKESKARCVVDVQRAVRDPTGNAEKVISILGQPEGCSKACVKILEVVRKEMEKDNTIAQHPEIELKIRAHNQLVGRLIGKGGATIKKIMEETGAHIYVSNNLSDPTFTRDAYGLMPPYAASLYGSDMAMHVERTVTVKAPDMSVVSAAEQKISQKLRQSFEADLSNRILYPSTGAAAAMPLMASMNEQGYLGAAAGVPPTHYVRNAVPATTTGAGQQQVRTVHMWVPNNMVGALIGAKGVHIRNAMRATGAQVRIEGGGINKEKKDIKVEGNNDRNDKESAVLDSSKKETEVNERVTESVDDENNVAEKQNEKEENAEKGPSPKQSKEKEVHADERLVTITGSDPQQYKAQLWIYQRIAEQSGHYMDEVRLCTELGVPSKLVGRIIGKGGQNVRELQRMTGAQVKIPDDAGEDESQKSTTVRVMGNFHSSQAVQVRLGQLINDFTQRLNIGPANGQSASNTQGSSPGLHEAQW